ncbi:MAG: hypothetical protein ACYTGG_07210, partial [Planctomycetota bacterium]
MMTLLGCDDEILMELMRRGEFIPILAIVFGCTVGMVAIVGGIAAGVVKQRNFEKTRRELAAYVAE